MQSCSAVAAQSMRHRENRGSRAITSKTWITNSSQSPRLEAIVTLSRPTLKIFYPAEALAACADQKAAHATGPYFDLHYTSRQKSCCVATARA